MSCPIHRRLLAAAWLALLAIACPPLAAQTADPPPAVATPRPRIGLVLSGGGARGFAHVGVLRALQQLHVPVDIVVGTSMGCVVGGAYAAGSTVDALERIVRTTDWEAVLADRPARDELVYRRREEDIALPSRIEFGLDRSGLSLPPAAAGNAALEGALGKLLPAGMRERPVNQLPLPFRSVASDLVTGELVELVDTPLFSTLRASLAVPGVFEPVRVNGRLLVDGGLVRNLPVDMARALGADIIIAVNVGTPLAPEHTLSTSIGVAQQMMAILTEQNVQRSLKELGPRDILIAPELQSLSFLDFRNYEKAMRAGAAAVQRMADRLKPLALPAAEYTALEHARSGAPTIRAGALPLDRVEVQGTERIAPQALVALTGLQPGQPVTPEQAQQAAARLYGRGDLDRVDTEVRDQDGRRSVLIKVAEADWARSRLRVGLELASDFSDNNSFTLSAMHVAPSLNAWGAELRTVARIGALREFGMQWHQPLGAGSPWYVAPQLAYDASSFDVFSEGRRQSRAGYKLAEAQLAVGRELGTWGDVQLGVSRRAGRARLLVPQTTLDSGSFSDTTQFVQLSIDTLDSLAFPVRGQLLQARFDRAPSRTADEPTHAQSQITGLAAFGRGDWAGHVSVDWARARFGAAPLSLGGFLRLSGTEAESVTGQTVVLGRVVVARRVGTMPAPLGGAVRVGLSAELGGGFAPGASVRWRALTQAGAAFVSVDTRFGPVYFGAGSTRHGDGTVYLFLGPVW
ncbi:patatin-like phospholipase family protein [Aquabacterium sp.]|uniref:patatin-like phospholipase family protein n=1 Tax=Aquabacterium sp. TaxID=1872578 RepID=UPI003784F143